MVFHLRKFIKIVVNFIFICAVKISTRCDSKPLNAQWSKAFEYFHEIVASSRRLNIEITFTCRGTRFTFDFLAASKVFQVFARNENENLQRLHATRSLDQLPRLLLSDSLKRKLFLHSRNNQFIVLITHILRSLSSDLHTKSASISLGFMLQCAKYGNFYGASSN